MTPLERILDQAEKALADRPVAGMTGEYSPGLYGLTHRDLRLANIVAIARNALKEDA